MKRRGILTGIALAVFTVGVALWLCAYEPEILEESIVTREGIVTDRAMSDGIPYLTVKFPDGTEVCCWVIFEDVSVPEEVCPGRSVAVTYGTEKDRGRWVLLDIKLEELLTVE